MKEAVERDCWCYVKWMVEFRVDPCNPSRWPFNGPDAELREQRAGRGALGGACTASRDTAGMQKPTRPLTVDEAVQLAVACEDWLSCDQRVPFTWVSNRRRTFRLNARPGALLGARSIRKVPLFPGVDAARAIMSNKASGEVRSTMRVCDCVTLRLSHSSHVAEA